jgi:hypothetical protein
MIPVTKARLITAISGELGVTEHWVGGKLKWRIFSAVPGGTFSLLSVPGTCFAACRAIVSRAWGALCLIREKVAS